MSTRPESPCLAVQMFHVCALIGPANSAQQGEKNAAVLAVVIVGRKHLSQEYALEQRVW